MNLQNEISYRRSLFEQKVLKGAIRDCWEWNGAKSARGAGTFGLGDLGGVKSAHVAAWLLYRDSSYNVDSEHTFYHLCGNKSCVNPRHLAIIGASGLVNPQEVVRFLADGYPSVRTHLANAADGLPTYTDNGNPTTQSHQEQLQPERSADANHLFKRLVAWYSDQVDGEWENGKGVDIATYSAPGWAVKINLTGTELEDRPFNSIDDGTEGAPTGWLYCDVFSNTFRAWGDVNKLPLILEIFLGWARQ